jgi:hypothetical protein
MVAQPFPVGPLSMSGLLGFTSFFATGSVNWRLPRYAHARKGTRRFESPLSSIACENQFRPSYRPG